MRKTIMAFLFLSLAGLALQAESPVPASPVIHELKITKAIPFAKAGSRQLLLDVYTPLPASGPRPVLLIFHGGGWLINDRTIMDNMSAWMASHGNLVVVNADYRLLGDNDSTSTIPQLVGDCLAALAWTKVNIKDHGGDPGRIAVTGDSAGGHLASMVAMAGPRIGDRDFSAPDFILKPTALPSGTRVQDLDWSVQALISSYGVSDFYAVCKGNFEMPTNAFWTAGLAKAHQVIAPGKNVAANPDWYKAVSPLHMIPKAAERSLPPVYCQVGSLDFVVDPQSVKTFVAALNAKGHKAEYWEYPGKSHAYLDNSPLYSQTAGPALDRMIAWLGKTLVN